MSWIILIIILVLLIYVLLLFIIILVKRGKFDQKNSGEKSVETYLTNLCREKEYVVNDILLFRENHFSSQIDHVLLSRKGIFCIETKDYSGEIYGKKDERNWKQILANGEVINSLYNPIKQNKTHIFALKEKVEKRYYYNVVIFVSAEILDVDSEEVYTLDSFGMFYNSLEDSVDQFTIERIYQKLLNIKNNTVITKIEHVKNIKRQMWNVEHNICPRCGKNLVLVHDDKGIYYRCEGYPECTFKKYID